MQTSWLNRSMQKCTGQSGSGRWVLSLISLLKTIALNASMAVWVHPQSSSAFGKAFETKNFVEFKNFAIVQARKKD
jgi:hypothetical protein